MPQAEVRPRLLYGAGAGVAYGLACAFMLGAAALVLSIPKPAQHTEREQVTLAAIFGGFRYIREEKVVFGAISLDLFAVLLGGAVALMPVYARDILDLGPWGLGLLRAAPGVGAVAMGLYLAMNPVRDHAGIIMLAAVALFGLFTALFGISTMPWLSIAALALIPVIWFVLVDRPSDVGLLPYGADPNNPPAEEHNTEGSAATAAKTTIRTLVEVARHRTFWILAGTFFVCGWTTNGIVSTHFIPAAHDEGMHATAAAGLLAVVGLFDLIGTLGSGWLTDRFDPRKLLAMYYGFRSLALFALPVILGPSVEPPILVIMVVFGLDWVATVPPTAILCTRAFGREKGTIVFGWVFAAHMIGAAAAATASGVLRDVTGDYLLAWLLAGLLALGACAASLTLPRSLRRATSDETNPEHPHP